MMVAKDVHFTDLDYVGDSTLAKKMIHSIINPKKTEVISANLYIYNYMSMNNNNIQKMGEFVYLGAVVNSNRLFEHKIERRILLAFASISEFSNSVWKRQSMRLIAKIGVHGAIIRSTL